MFNTREKNKLLDRIKRVRGQVEAIARAIEADKNCAELLHVIVAARGGLNGLMSKVIEDHIRRNVVGRAKDHPERSQGAEDLIEVLRSYLR